MSPSVQMLLFQMEEAVRVNLAVIQVAFRARLGNTAPLAPDNVITWVEMGPRDWPDPRQPDPPHLLRKGAWSMRRPPDVA